MQNSDLISVIITCYNEADYIEQAIGSIVNQTHFNKEIIVVDDGSDKKTKAVLQSVQHKIDKLITQENKGQSSARNNGIKSAKSGFIVVLDGDDYFENTFIEKAITLFKRDPKVKLVTCFANLIFNDNTKNYIYKPKGGNVKSFLTANSALGSAMFKKADWEAYGGYDASMREGFEDWEFYIRLLSKGGIAEVIKEPLYNYRKRKHTTTAKANNIKYDLFNFLFTKHRDLNIKYYDDFIKQLLEKLEKEEREKLKNRNRLEFKLGELILTPFRWVKSFFK